MQTYPDCWEKNSSDSGDKLTMKNSIVSLFHVCVVSIFCIILLWELPSKNCEKIYIFKAQIYGVENTKANLFTSCGRLKAAIHF